MVNERNNIQPECTRSLKELGFTVDVTRDFLRCPKCFTAIYPSSATGRFDTVASFPVSYGETHCLAIEVKYGGSTNLAFNRVEEDQREWYESHKEDYDSFWLWYCIGDRINGKTHPRKTWLIPFEVFLELEKILDRKSIPFDLEEVYKYELVWEGDGFWSVPQTHELWEQIRELMKVQGE